MRVSLIMVMILLGVDTMAMSTADKVLLDRHLAGKRIVFLGEPDHWIKEKTEYQKEFLEYLISKGFNVIGNERGFIDSTFVDDYVQTGEKDFLKKCGECGYRGPNWPDRNMSGILNIPDEFKSLYLEGMQKNDQDFYDFLKEQRSKYQISYLGYDVDKIPDVIFDKLTYFIELITNSGIEELKEFAKLLQRSTEGNFVLEASNLKVAVHSLPKLKLERVFNENQLNTFYSLLVQLEETVRFASIAYNNPNSEKLMDAYGEREKTMFRIVDEVLSRPDAKVVLLGHNAHLPKDHMEYRRIYEVEGNRIETPGWLTLGAYLHEKYKGQTLAIWMLYDSGSHSAPFCKVEFPCQVDSIEGTLEAWLAENRNDGLYDSATLIGESGLEKISWRENAVNTVTGDLKEVVDLIYFRRKVSGL